MLKKGYMNKKEHNLKGDWLRMVMKCFDFIQEQIDDKKDGKYSKGYI